LGSHRSVNVTLRFRPQNDIRSSRSLTFSYALRPHLSPPFPRCSKFSCISGGLEEIRPPLSIQSLLFFLFLDSISLPRPFQLKAFRRWLELSANFPLFLRFPHKFHTRASRFNGASSSSFLPLALERSTLPSAGFPPRTLLAFLFQRIFFANSDP